MKLATLVAVSLIATSAVSGSAIASPSARGGGPPCSPKVTKIQGKTAVVGCGPATLTVKAGGKSYSFKNGLCTTSGSTTFELDLGTVVTADLKHNAGLPYASITVAGRTSAIIDARFGGKDIIGGLTLLTVKGAGTNTGTFVNRLSTPKVSGSWNCHGVIFKDASGG